MTTLLAPPIKVGFDFDEPIHPWFEYAHEACIEAGLIPPGTPIPTNYDPMEEYGCTREEWIEVLDREVLRPEGGIYSKPIRPGTVKQIKRLYVAGYEIHIVTARGSFGDLGERVKELTRRQILLESLPHHGLHFNHDKGPLIKELGLDYFVDDSPMNWWDSFNAGAETYLYDAPWNQDVDIDPRYRVKSLREYVNKIIDKHGWKNELSYAQKLAVNPGHPY